MEANIRYRNKIGGNPNSSLQFVDGERKKKEPHTLLHYVFLVQNAQISHNITNASGVDGG